MTRKTPPVNVAASVRARLLQLAKTRHEDFTLTLMNYAAERFLYRLSQSPRRQEFVLKGAMLFAAQIGLPYRPTRDLDLLGLRDDTEAAMGTAMADIVATPVVDDGVEFDANSITVTPIRDDSRYGGLRVVMQAHLASARIHMQIDVGFGDAITPAALDLTFPTLLADLPHEGLRRRGDCSAARRVRWGAARGGNHRNISSARHAIARGRDGGVERSVRPRCERSGQLESILRSQPTTGIRVTARSGRRASPIPAATVRRRSFRRSVHSSMEPRWSMALKA